MFLCKESYAFSIDIFATNYFLVVGFFFFFYHFRSFCLTQSRPVHLLLCVLPLPRFLFSVKTFLASQPLEGKIGKMCSGTSVLQSTNYNINGFHIVQADNQLCQLNTLLASCGRSITGLLHLNRAGWSRKIMPLITAKRKKFGQNDSLHHRFCLLVGN